MIEEDASMSQKRYASISTLCLSVYVENVGDEWMVVGVDF